MNILLVKLAVAGSELLQRRMREENDYVQVDDAGMLKLIRDVTKVNANFVTSIKEVNIHQVDLMSTKFIGEYSHANEMLHMVELESKMMVIVNPTRSAIIDDYTVDADLVKDKLSKMGYESSLLVKRNERTNPNRMSKKARFKPRRNIGQTTKNRYKKDNTWIPDVIRRNHEGGYELPAVIIR